MAFEKILPMVVSTCYLITALLCLMKGQHAAAWMWLCYGLANIGIINMMN